MNQLWDYLVVDHELAPGELDKHGQAGWELVAVDRHGAACAFYFKRPAGVRDDPAPEDRGRRARSALQALRAG